MCESCNKLKIEKEALLESLILCKTKHNNDKVRYRRKAKKYRAERDYYRNVLSKTEKFIDLALEVYNNVDTKTLLLIKDKIKELKEVDSNG